jgi:hypothetical protein
MATKDLHSLALCVATGRVIGLAGKTMRQNPPALLSYPRQWPCSLERPNDPRRGHAGEPGMAFATRAGRPQSLASTRLATTARHAVLFQSKDPDASPGSSFGVGG